MTHILIADKVQHAPMIRSIFLEYLVWGADRVNREYGLNFVADEFIEQDMVSLDRFMPPKGRLLLALVDDTPVGVACLKDLAGPTGEIKRMYVQPAFRGRGIGKALLQRLIEEALGIGYTRLKLDSAGFMTEAHQLYRSLGFTQVAPYPESEIPQEFHQFWVFMEKQIA